MLKLLKGRFGNVLVVMIVAGAAMLVSFSHYFAAKSYCEKHGLPNGNDNTKLHPFVLERLSP